MQSIIHPLQKRTIFSSLWKNWISHPLITNALIAVLAAFPHLPRVRLAEGWRPCWVKVGRNSGLDPALQITVVGQSQQSDRTLCFTNLSRTSTVNKAKTARGQPQWTTTMMCVFKYGTIRATNISWTSVGRSTEKWVKYSAYWLSVALHRGIRGKVVRRGAEGREPTPASKARGWEISSVTIQANSV